MKLAFAVAGKPVEFTRSWFTGHAVLAVDGARTTLQHAANASTHFSFSRVHAWATTISGHRLVIEKRRPALFAGFRPQHYRVILDDVVIAEGTGF